MKYFIVFIFLFDIIIYSQDSLINNLYETNFQSYNIEDKDELFEYLELLKKDPVNINSASLNTLLKIPFLTEQSAYKIITYRQAAGNIYSLTDLFSAGLDRETINNIGPYIIFFDNKPDKVKEKFYLGSTLLSDYYDKLNLNNDNTSSFSKAYYSTGNYDINFITAKDGGEDFNDYYSFSFQYRGNSFFNNIILGDYNISHSQGLLFSARTISSYSSLADRNSFSTFYRHVSNNENNFLRGGLIGFKYKKFEGAIFISKKYLDANLDSNGVNYFYTSGLHKTESQLSNKQNTSEFLSGVIINFNCLDNLFASAAYYYRTLDKVTNNDKFFNNAASFSFNYIINNLNFFSETSLNDKVSDISGFSIYFNKLITYTLSYRNYKSFNYNIYAHPYSVSYFKNDEEGLLNKIRIKLEDFEFKLSYDQYKLTEVGSLTGNKYNISSNIKMSEDILLNGGIEILTKTDSLNLFTDKYNLLLTYRIDKATLKNRLCVYNDKRYKTAYFFYQDFESKIFNNLKLNLRTTSYYIDLNKTLIEYSSGFNEISNYYAFSGKGIRYYIILEYSFLLNFNLMFKYANDFNSIKNNSELGIKFVYQY